MQSANKSSRTMARLAASRESNSRTTLEDDASCSSALDSLIREHRHAVMAQAVRLTAGDQAWAEDVVQETFIRAWRHLSRMTNDYGSVRSWLLRVAHNVTMDGYRARRARPMEAEETELWAQPVADASDHVLSAMLLRDALSQLPEKHRDVLSEIYFHDRTLADTAHRLNLPLGTVKSRVFYALRVLRTSARLQPSLG